MIQCPWCGTEYETFRSNCKNCGGPMHMPEPAPVTNPLDAAQPNPPAPPQPPRPISNSYVSRILSTDGLMIAGGVFALVGLILTMVGGGLTLGVVTAFVGVPFLGIGLLLLAAGGGLLIWRVNEARAVVRVLVWGQAAAGEITGVEENLSVVINNRSPWVITYQYQAGGQRYDGKVTTLTRPSSALKAGAPATVLYLPDAPGRSALYPHP